MAATTCTVRPEQALRQPEGARTEIYALGVLLYRLLLDRTPFSRLTGASVLVAHVRQAVLPFAELDPHHGLSPIFE